MKHLRISMPLLAMLILWAGSALSQSGVEPAQPGGMSNDVVPAYIPPANPALAPVKLPPVKEKVLQNGLKILVVEFHEVPVVSLRLQCKTGSFLDPDEKAGLTQFMTGLLTQGTESLSATQIAEKIDFVGGNISAGCSWDASYVECSVLKKHLSVASELMRDVTLHPAFADDEIERLRQQTLSSIKNDKDQPGTLASDEFYRWLYGEHRFGQPIDGTEETVTSFTRADVRAQYRMVFIPNNSTLAVIGDITEKDALRLAESMLGDWPKGEIPASVSSTTQAPQGHRVHIVNKPDATQSQIRIGHLGVARQTDDYFPIALMNYILGGGGFSSRLTKVIRAEKGLTYGIGSGYNMNKVAGPYVINTFTKNESVLEAIQETIKQVRKYQEEGPTETELREAKSYMTGSYPLNFETPSQIAGQLLSIELYDLGVDYIEKYRTRIEAVTEDDVKRVAQKYIHPEDMNIVVVSKAEDVRNALESLGPVEVEEIQ